MKKVISLFAILLILLLGLFFYNKLSSESKPNIESLDSKPAYWLLLHRKSNVEFLFLGIPGEKEKSKLIKTFNVKSGIPNERPTPLPKLLGKEYWIITQKEESKDNPETAPYFLTLNIPITDEEPFGPTPYLECNGQCNWILPGAFGLHGINGDESRLSKENPGSSGCIRHRDADIAYLFNLLDPEKEEIRYYIEDK